MLISLPCVLSLLSLASLLSFAAADSLVEPGSKDNSAECECYLVSGPDPGYFQYHRFWDFRDIPNDGDNDFTVAPSLITAEQNQGNENVTTSYFNTTQWNEDWSMAAGATGSGGPVTAVDSPQNIYISRNSTDGADASTYLTLRATRLPGFMSTAELDSNQLNMLHCSIRGRLRVIPNGLSGASSPSAQVDSLNNATTGSNASHPVDEGAVMGFFTFESNVDESDIEVLTRDPTTVIHYSNQPDYNQQTQSTVDGASTQLDMPNDYTYDQWLNHRLDWYPDVSRWYINDDLQLNKTLNVPQKPSGLIVNLWGDGGEWSGNMSVGGQVLVGVEWIEMVFNISGDVKGPNARRDLEGRATKSCSIGCNVDGVQQIGFPELAYNTTSSAGASLFRQGGGHALGISLALVLGVYLHWV